MKKSHALMIAAMMVGSHQAAALINDSKFNDPGELFISVWDEAGARSYYKDLGITLTDFIDGKSCINGDLAADPNFASFSGAKDLVYNIAAVNSLVKDQAGNPANITRWGYLATSSAGDSIFNASWNAIDNTRQKIQGYIGNLNGVAFTNAPGEAAENKSGIFQANGLGYHGSPAWGASMGRSVGGSTEGVPGTPLEFFFVNNSNGTNTGKQVTKLGAWNLDGGKLAYSGTGTTAQCSGGGPNPGKFLLTVALSGTGKGVVNSSPVGIACGADCSEDFASGTPVTLTATAEAGSSFTGWSGGNCTGAGVCTVTVSSAINVQAAFTADAPAGPGIKLNSPALWKVRQAQNITWSESQVSPKSKATVAFSKNGGAKFSTLKNVPVTKRALVWKPTKAHVTTNGVLRVCVKPDPKKSQQVCDSNRVVVQP